MIRKPDSHDRRILTFPAVQPCESISPKTLLNSLIAISRTICGYRSKFIGAKRRNGREAIRLIEILQLFFEEIHDGRSRIVPKSVIICLSEMHVAFQKINFLLEDCSHKGYQLWILMNSEFIEAQFRDALRSIATALDVLPFGKMSVTDDVKECVELVARQARSGRFEIDGGSQRALIQVQGVLKDLECKVLPEEGLIKEILGYLEIRTWNECNNEIKFLEEQVALHGDKTDLPLLSSLAAFMSYCRAAMFETFEGRADGQPERSFNSFNCLNIEDFMCPISLELMNDPVTVSTGQTYDRSSIEKWLESGTLICPKTQEKLRNTELRPNLAVRNVMRQYCHDHSIFISIDKKRKSKVAETIVASGPAAAEAIKFLAQFLTFSLVYGTSYQKNKAAYEIRLLAKSNIFYRSCLIEACAIPPLLKLLTSQDPSTLENAISSVLKLSKHPDGKRAIMYSGGLRPIIAVLKRSHNPESSQLAAAILFYLSSVEEFRDIIGKSSSAIADLVKLLKDGTPCGKKNAVAALYELLRSPENHRITIESGAVPLLLNLKSNSPPESPNLGKDSMAVLAILAESFEGVLSIRENSGLPRIAKLLCSTGTSRAVREHCVSTLHSICVYCGTEVIGILSRDVSIMSSLYSLSTEGSADASGKAREIIRLLQNFQERIGPSGLVSSSSAASRDQYRFVHVR